MQYLRSYLAEQFCQDCTWQSRYDLFRTQSNPDDTVAILLIRIARSCACKKDYPIFPGLFLRPLFFRGRVIKILRNKKKKKKKRKAPRKSRGRSFYQACPWIRPSDSGIRGEGRLNFMTGFPLIISSFCTPGWTGFIQSTADLKRGIDSFSLNATELHRPTLPLCWIKRSPCARWKLYISPTLDRVTLGESGPIARGQLST